MKLASIVLLTVGPAFCQCTQLSGNDIRVEDLAATVAAFRMANPGTILAAAPAPGVRRVFTFRDLLSAARSTGVSERDLPATGVCFERALREMNERELIAAMRQAFPETAVQIEIIDRSRYLVPPGQTIFRLAGLSFPPPAQPGAAVLWRGRVFYDETRSIEIWARVRISAMTKVCVAARDIVPGRPIEPGQVRLEQVEGFPLLRSGSFDAVEKVAGRVARKPVRAGQEIAAQVLEDVRDIHAGDTVRVSAVSGNARISMEARAVTAGSKGETITLRNTSTQASFRAVVEGKGRAAVEVSPGGTL